MRNLSTKKFNVNVVFVSDDSDMISAWSALFRPYSNVSVIKSSLLEHLKSRDDIVAYAVSSTSRVEPKFCSSLKSVLEASSTGLGGYMRQRTLERYGGEQPVGTVNCIPVIRNGHDARICLCALKYADEPLSGPLVIYQCVRELLRYCQKNSIAEIIIPDLGLDEGLPPSVIAETMAYAYESAKTSLETDLNANGEWIVTRNPDKFPLFLKAYSVLTSDSLHSEDRSTENADESHNDVMPPTSDVSKVSDPLSISDVDDVKNYMNRIFKRG